MNGELRNARYALLNAQGVVVRSGNLTGDEVVIETSEPVSGSISFVWSMKRVQRRL